MVKNYFYSHKGLKLNTTKSRCNEDSVFLKSQLVSVNYTVIKTKQHENKDCTYHPKTIFHTQLGHHLCWHTSLDLSTEIITIDSNIQFMINYTLPCLHMKQCLRGYRYVMASSGEY